MKKGGKGKACCFGQSSPSLQAGAVNLGRNYFSLTNTARMCPDFLSLSIFILSFLLLFRSLIKTNHTKTGPTLSFCSRPTSLVVGTGQGWEAGSG